MRRLRGKENGRREEATHFESGEDCAFKSQGRHGDIGTGRDVAGALVHLAAGAMPGTQRAAHQAAAALHCARSAHRPVHRQRRECANVGQNGDKPQNPASDEFHVPMVPRQRSDCVTVRQELASNRSPAAKSYRIRGNDSLEANPYGRLLESDSAESVSILSAQPRHIHRDLP